MQQGVTEQDALRFVAQIAAALQVVHHAGHLHRDLKPPNVMLRENGDVALIDFGLARALDGSSSSVNTRPFLRSGIHRSFRSTTMACMPVTNTS